MEETKYLLVGGGLAAVWAAQTIRSTDKEGRLIIVGEESRPPYDKPPLSKQYLGKDDVAEDDAYSKFDNFYPDNNIDLQLGSKAVQLDRSAQTVTLENGTVLHYEKLLLCTGSDPRIIDLPGSKLKNIFYLRKLDEALAIRAAMKESKTVVLVGAGYLNMEVASGALAHGLDVTLIEPSDYPWSRFASPTLGKFMADYYTGKGAKFVFGDEVTSFEGEGHVSAVHTKSGKRFEADLALVSIGATLNTELAKAGGLEVDDREGVTVNEYLQTSDPHVWAAGDIACFQDVALDKRWHAEHHLNAKWQGRAVGANMAAEADGQKPYDQVPYFFSDFLDLHMVQRGDPSVGKKPGTTILGDLNGAEFVELYPDANGVLRMGVAISHEEKTLDPISDKLEELIRAGTLVAQITAEAVGL